MLCATMWVVVHFRKLTKSEGDTHSSPKASTAKYGISWWVSLGAAVKCHEVLIEWQHFITVDVLLDFVCLALFQGVPLSAAVNVYAVCGALPKTLSSGNSSGVIQGSCLEMSVMCFNDLMVFNILNKSRR